MEFLLASRYRLLKPLSRGGFGQTFLAADEHLPGQPVCVVKQLQLKTGDRTAMATAQRLFNLEAETLYRLGGHDQIPRLLAHFEHQGEFYLVQEYVEGVALSRELTQRGPYSELEAIAFLHDVLPIVAFVHDQGVIHRDVKPANLIRRGSDRKLVLIDFGAVKQLTTTATDVTQRESFTIAIGSPGYMPVEQQLFQPRFGSDIYAVGIVVLQAMTGISPLEFPYDPQTGKLQILELLPSGGASAGVVALLARMVHPDVNYRYQTGREALAAVLALGQGKLHPDADHTPTVLPLPETQLTEPPAALVVQADADTAPPLAAPTQQDNSPLAPPLSRREYRNRQALLNKVKTFWIQGVLNASLHDQVLIALGMDEYPGAIAPPWNLSVAHRHQPPKTLDGSVPVTQIFDEIGPGRTLLILGEPGAGKTTTLLQLAQALVERAEQDSGALLPVVLNLASWSGWCGKTTTQERGNGFADWIVDELSLKYQVPKKIGKPWVDRQQLLLLLDGLDEVYPAAQGACVEAINQFQQIYGPEMIVCSRIQDYEALSVKLSFQSAIFLRSLTAVQVRHYLDALTADLTGLRALIGQDGALQELARSPLMLNIMVLAYQGVTAQELPQTTTVAERRQQLFDLYIQRTLTRRIGPHPYPNDQTIHWLSWLAQQMQRQSQTVFLIERLQPGWLGSVYQSWVYRLGAALLAGLSVGLGYGLISQMSFGLLNLPYRGIPETMANKFIDGVIVGTVTGLCISVALMLVPTEIKTIETTKWSWRSASQGLLLWAPVGLGMGWIGGALVEAVHRSLFRLPIQDLLSLFSGHDAMVGLIAGVIYGLTSGLAATEIETQIVPNQAIWISATSARWFGLIGGLFGGLAGFGSGWLMGEPLNGLVSGLSIGVVIGIIGGGGLSCVKHGLLRFLLWRGRCLPWNCARFLNYASDRILLQKVGGGYIFIHRLLLEHFAALPKVRNAAKSL